MGKNLQNDQNWPFWANLTWLFWQNSSLWVMFSQLGVKGIQKIEKLKKFAYVLSCPRNANFWDFGWNEMLWCQKMGKVVNCMKMAIPNESEPHYGEKPTKWPELAIMSQSNWLFLAKFGIVGHFYLICHLPRFYWKLTEKIEFFCFHNFLLIFSKISVYSCVDSLELTCYMIFISHYMIFISH